MPSPLQRIRDVSEGQWGLLTLQQASAAGVAWRSIARLVDAGLLERVAHGVYRVRGGAEPDHLGLRAAWLQLDPSRPAWARLGDPDVALVSHTSAAMLYGIGDLRADTHEFTLARRYQTRRADVRIHRGTVPQQQRVLAHGLPTTRAGWMIGDLLADHVDPDAVAQITSEVIDRNLDRPQDVAEAIAGQAHHLGLRRGDGGALLGELLLRAGYRDRRPMAAVAG